MIFPTLSPWLVEARRSGLACLGVLGARRPHPFTQPDISHSLCTTSNPNTYLPLDLGNKKRSEHNTSASVLSKSHPKFPRLQPQITRPRFQSLLSPSSPFLTERYSSFSDMGQKQSVHHEIEIDRSPQEVRAVVCAILWIASCYLIPLISLSSSSTSPHIPSGRMSGPTSYSIPKWPQLSLSLVTRSN